MSGELILVVEDHGKNRKLLRDLLQLKGYRTLETDNGEQGVELAGNFRPALILMDIQLPGIDGVEALRRLRADPKTASIPVVAITASVMRGDRAQIEAAGFDGYHPKPINVQEVLASIRELLDQRTES